MNIIMISADRSVVAGEKGPFYSMLEEFHRHFDRIDVIGLRPARVVSTEVFGNVFLNPPRTGKWVQPLFIYKTGLRLLGERPYAFAVSHDYNFFYNGLGAWLLNRKTKLPYFSELHHVPGHPRASNFRERLDRFCTRLYASWVQRHALAIRVVNAKELPSLLKSWGVAGEKIKVLYSLYLDLETFRPGPSPKEYDLMFCGRLVANKGIFLILEALKKLIRDFPAIRLLVVGRGPQEKELDRTIAREGLSKHVHRIPWVAEVEELAELYRRSRVVVCASYNEGGPRFTLEAMACGTPVISTPVGLMSELIREGQNGMLFSWDPEELAEKAKALLGNTELYGKIRPHLRETALPFEKSKVLADLAKGFKELAAAKVRTS